MGSIGIPEPIYELMTLRSIFNAVRGYSLRQEDEWRRARLIAFFASPPEIIKKAKTPAGLFALSGDQQSGVTPKTIEEYKNKFARIDEAIKEREKRKQQNG